MNPRSIMLLLIGFMGGLSVSFIRVSLGTWGSAVGFRLPRSYMSHSLPRESFASGGGTTGGGGVRSLISSKGSSSSSSSSSNNKWSSKSKDIDSDSEESSSSSSSSKSVTVKGASTTAKKTSSSSSSKNTSPVEENPLISARDRYPGICESIDAMTEGPRSWHIFSPDEFDETLYPCHWTNLTHWQLAHYHKLGPIKMCTHDPEVDTVISSHLHKYGFWGAPDEFMILLSTGPCSEERPYMLDIGGNIGLFTLLGASRGCRVFAFEPLSENIQRFAHSVIANGWWDRVRLFKHAVGKFFTTVTIGFRPSNPGSSGINLGGSKSERIEQITIDGLLLGHSPPSLPGNFPPVIGSRLGFVKVDTEGYDIAVIGGMLRTLIDGKVPHMLIEFSPGDAAGTAGCDPAYFVKMMYDEGYTMYEYAKPIALDHLLETMIPNAIEGKGKRVFESWFIRNDVASGLLKNGKLRSEN